MITRDPSPPAYKDLLLTKVYVEPSRMGNVLERCRGSAESIHWNSMDPTLLVSMSTLLCCGNNAIRIMGVPISDNGNSEVFGFLRLKRGAPA